jgi:formylglycine-generating enzyme required for sulfatase activity
MTAMRQRTTVAIIGILVVVMVWLLWPDARQTDATAQADGPVEAAGNNHSPTAVDIFTNSIGMKFVTIEPGEFMMGPEPEEGADEDEHPQRRVRIARPFLLGMYEVTQKQWVAMMGTNPSMSIGDHLPVERVSSIEALAFCRKLSERESKRYRLATEAEWEYACRAGTTTHFSFGDRAEDLHQYGNYCDVSNRDNFPWQDQAHDDRYNRTAPVGSYRPNAWGLHDMHGNVMEWCQDEPGAKAADAQDEGRGIFRTVRGGSWSDSSVRCRSAHRLRSAPDSRSMLTGLRVVLEVDEPVSDR